MHRRSFFTLLRWGFLASAIGLPSSMLAQSCGDAFGLGTAEWQACHAPTFLPATLQFAAPGSYPQHYLGKLIALPSGGASPTVDPSLLGQSLGVTVSNVTLSSTPPSTAPVGDTGSYVYGDITIVPGTSTHLGLILSFKMNGVEILTAVDDLLASAAKATCGLVGTDHVQVSVSQPVQLFGLPLFTQVVTLKNTGSTLTGPIFLAANQLSSNAKLFGAIGTAHCVEADGAAYQVAAPALSAGASVKVVLTFTNSLVPNGVIAYQPVVFTGVPQP